ncbi:MAG: hypothetical protein WBM54_02050 [Woeseia sp.]
MNDSRLDELLNAELDNELSTDEQQELQQLLETSDEAAAERRTYMKLDQMLRDMPQQLLPAMLHQRIVSGARLPKAEAKTRPSWFGNLWQSPVTRFSFAAAAGVLLSLAIFNAGGPNIVEAPSSDMLGSMVPTQGDSVDLIDRLQLSGAGFASGATLLQQEEGLILSIDLESDTPVEITVDFSNSGVQPTSLSNASNNFEIANFEAPFLRLRGNGQRKLQLSLSRIGDATAADAATIQLEFSSTGHASQRGSLRLSH